MATATGLEPRARELLAYHLSALVCLCFCGGMQSIAKFSVLSAVLSEIFRSWLCLWLWLWLWLCWSSVLFPDRNALSNLVDGFWLRIASSFSFWAGVFFAYYMQLFVARVSLFVRLPVRRPISSCTGQVCVHPVGRLWLTFCGSAVVFGPFRCERRALDWTFSCGADWVILSCSSCTSDCFLFLCFITVDGSSATCTLHVSEIKPLLQEEARDFGKNMFPKRRFWICFRFTGDVSIVLLRWVLNFPKIERNVCFLGKRQTSLSKLELVWKLCFSGNGPPCAW